MNLWNYFNFPVLIFPELCLNCGIKLNSTENQLCANCLSELKFFTENYCPVCGSYTVSTKCSVCIKNDFFFDKARSAFQMNSTLKKLIHAFKYEEMTKTGKFLADLTSDFLEQNHPFESVDFVIPTPLHYVKKRIRGYNQAEILSKIIAEKLNWEHIPNLIVRNQFTKTQTKLNRIQRQKNVSQAFIINNKHNIRDKNILVVDDVFTTGSTANEISSVLKNNKVKNVFILTIARA